MKSSQSKTVKLPADASTENVTILKSRWSLSPSFASNNKQKWLPTATLPMTIASTPKNSTRHHQQNGRRRAENSMSDNSLPSSYSSEDSASTNNQALASLSSSLTSQLDENSFNSFTQNSNEADDDFSISMRNEVTAAVDYLTYLLTKANFDVELTELFRQSLTDLLFDHYSGHWYPDEPLRGSGYRCLRVNGVMHPILANAADLCSLEVAKFRRAFPAEFTIWIDPGNVNVRIGEDGSIGAFSKTDLNASRSTSPCLFSATTTPSTTANYGNSSSSSTPAGRKSVPVTTSQRRTSMNRTRLFQQQTTQQASFLKDVPSPKVNLEF
uniref:Anti-proliferative protein domain-containing protein n=1 Tax=Romanomermis culicivorax TaxID=13658 RepID=A0A915JDN4_ROMCU